MVLQLLTTTYGLGLQAAVLQGQYDYPDDPDGLRRYNGTVATFLLFWPLLFHGLLEGVGPGLLDAWFPQMPWDPYGRMLSITALLSTAVAMGSNFDAADPSGRDGPFLGSGETGSN